MAVVNAWVYSEVNLKERLAAGDLVEQVHFACACAERIFPLYELFAARTGQGDPALVRTSLDRAWAIQDGASADDDIEQLRERVEALVPHDDQPDFSTWSPFAQNAAAAVAYALRLWLSGDSQNGVWAARQLYEAADYVAQIDDVGDNQIDATDPVSFAVRAIDRVLDDFKTESAAGLRDASVLDGLLLLRIVSNGPLG